MKIEKTYKVADKKQPNKDKQKENKITHTESEDAMELTVNSYIFRETKKLLEKELGKCFKLLKQTEDKWNNYTDLKLHDILYNNIEVELNGVGKVVFNDDYINSMFEEFCDISFSEFKEWIITDLNTTFEDMAHYIGRTSRFYIGNLHNGERNAEHYIMALSAASKTLCESDTGYYARENENGFIVDFSDIDFKRVDIEDTLNDMLEVIDNVYEELETTIKDITAIWDYIEDFKNNQVEDFKEFLMCNIEF